MKEEKVKKEKTAAPGGAPAGNGEQKLEALAAHVDQVHREFSAKLRTLQQTAERNRQATILFSRALYLPLRPLRGGAFALRCLFRPVSSIRIIRDYLFIRKSKTFDRQFYMRVYPDITACAFDPLFHYCRFGWREKRNPRPDFVTAVYLQKNPDVTASGMNPFYHYLRYGKKESWRNVSVAPAPASAPRSQGAVPALSRIHFSAASDPLTADTVERIGREIRKGLYNGC